MQTQSTFPSCPQCGAAVKRKDQKYCSYSCRCTAINPMRNPASVAKVFVSGNRFERKGKPLTLQQETLMRYLRRAGLRPVAECPIATGVPKKNRLRLRTCYIVDLALQEFHIAIEIDGNSHRGASARIRDGKKDYALRGKGWKVLRFKNADIDRNVTECVRQIQQAITERTGVTK